MKKLKDLNLLDDFLFEMMLTTPGVCEEFCRIMLEIIFDRTFDKIVVTPQKRVVGVDMGFHGTRFDVYVEELLSDDVHNNITENAVATIYDVEPDLKENEKKILPLRTRYYHATIDARLLKTGEGYNRLKKVFVIFITDFDPFTSGRKVYTIKNYCVEEPEMEYEDGVRTLFFYTKGEVGNISEDLQNFLKYMENTTEKNVVGDKLKDIHRMVERVKNSPEVSKLHIDYEERERRLIEESLAKGEQQEKYNTVIMLNKEGDSIEKIARITRLSVSEVKEIISKNT